MSSLSSSLKPSKPTVSSKEFLPCQVDGQEFSQSHSSLILVSPQRQFLKKHNFYSRMFNSRRTLSALLYTHCRFACTFSRVLCQYLHKPHCHTSQVSGHERTWIHSTQREGKYPIMHPKREIFMSSVRKLYFWVQDAFCTPHFPTFRAVTRTVKY